MATSLLFICNNCGIEFSDPYRVRRYCSKSCYGQHGVKQKRATRKDSGTKKSLYETLNCYNCGCLFERRKSEVRQGKAQFCSRKCYLETGTATVMALSDTRFGRKRVREGGLGFHFDAPDLIRNKSYGNPKSWSIDNGYILYYWREHPAAPYGRIHQHRAIAYELWGDKIKGMHIDHINGDKSDNRPENLQILTAKEHASKTAKSDGSTAFASWVREMYPHIYDEWSDLRKR